jgi:hypothetical protein
MLEPVRECIFVRPVHFHSGKAAALVKLSPPVPGAVFGDNAAEISDVIVTSREEGENLFAIKRFPCHVYIARLRRPGVTTESTLGKADLEILGWGELYRTRTDAAQHVFDAD